MTQVRAADVPGDMHFIREVRRVGRGGKPVGAEDRGRSGYNRGTPLMVAWCGVEAGTARGSIKMTYNRAVVSCDGCLTESAGESAAGGVDRE